MRQHSIKQKRNFFVGPVLLAVTLAIAGVLVLPGAALAADYYVDINAVTDGDGSAGTPWKYLHSAATALWGDNSGQTLHVAAGEYSVNNGEADANLEFSNSNFTIQGDPAGGTIIDATGTNWDYGLHFDNCANVTISYLEIRNAGLYGLYLYDGSDNTVTRCTFHNHGDVADAGIALSQCGVNTVISGNIIYDNYYGVYIWSADVDTSPTIINNLIYDGPSSLMNTGIYASATVTPPATITVAPGIYHNTIDGGADTGIDLDSLNAGVSLAPDIQYNNLTNFAYGIADTGSAASAPTIDYNNLFGNATPYDNVSVGTNDISGDPLYNAPGMADYHIQAGSACVDAAITSTTTTDLDGTDRTAEGAYPDIGCYEHIVVPTGGQPPENPEYVSPAPFQIFAPGEDVTLKASAFVDPEGDSHLRSHWQITLAPINYFIFTSVPFDYIAEGSDLTSHTISADAFTEGTAYQWRVGYQDSGSLEYAWTKEPSKLEIPPNVFIVGVLENDVPLPSVDPGITQADYRMVSFTHIPRNPRAVGVWGDDLVGGYNPSLYRIGTYDCEYNGGAYREYPYFNIYPGGAAWVLAKNGLNADISGVPVNEEQPIESPLRYNDSNGNGWNMVGPPNNREYLWEDIMVRVYNPETGEVIFNDAIVNLAEGNPYIDTRLWEWVDGKYVSDSTIMEPGHGYWVRARQHDVNLRFPGSFSGGGMLVGRATGFSPKIILARAIGRLKRMAGKIFSQAEAIAAGNDSPPAPMAGISSSGSDRSSSSVDVSCFLSSLKE